MSAAGETTGLGPDAPRTSLVPSLRPAPQAPPVRPRPFFALRLRTKLLLATMGVVAVALVAAHAYLSSALESLVGERIMNDLSVRADLVTREAERAPFDEGDTAWDALADDLGARAHARVTLIRLDGKLLGDSELDVAELPTAENHADRPEVREALLSGRGVSSRYSRTLREQMLYVAMPIRRAGATIGVARVALPLTEVEHAKERLRRALFAGAGLALLVALVMSFLSAEWTARVARRLTAAARAMAAGDFTTKVQPSGADEFADLGFALDQLAESLSRTLRELGAERDFIERILQGMQEGVLLLDRNGKVALVNGALRQMLYLGADWAGKAPIEVIQNAELMELVERARSTKSTQSAELELTGIKPRRLLVRAVPLAGEPGGLLAVFVDVTDIRRLESLRRDFVANASHELRTPVTAVRSAAETLRGAAASDPEAAAHFIEIIERNAERLQLLVEDLLDLSRIEARELRFNLADVELSEFVDHVLGLLADRAKKKNIRLRAALRGDLPPVRADRHALEQVLTNLVENAVKYSNPGAEVVVGAEAEAAVVRVTVTDTGPGIEQKHLPRLFERFYRVDAGRSRELGGTGLGLSIVRHLVEAMGGTVGVKSTLGKGSTFAFTVPRGGDDVPASERTEAAEPLAEAQTTSNG